MTINDRDAVKRSQWRWEMQASLKDDMYDERRCTFHVVASSINSAIEALRQHLESMRAINMEVCAAKRCEKLSIFEEGVLNENNL